MVEKERIMIHERHVNPHNCTALASKSVKHIGLTPPNLFNPTRAPSSSTFFCIEPYKTSPLTTEEEDGARRRMETEAVSFTP